MKFRLPTKNRTLLLSFLLGAVLPLLISASTGNLSIPHNDSWAYSRIAKEFSTTGQINLLGWNRASLVGQFIPFKPFFDSLIWQQLFVVISSIVLLSSVYVFLRNNLNERLSALGTLALAIWPGFSLLSTSFMSDIPALTAMFLCLIAGQKALKTNSWFWLGLSLVIGFWAVTIREQSIAAPVAMLIYALSQNIQNQRFKKKKIIFSGVLFFTAVIIFQIWRSNLPNSDSASFEIRDNWISVLGSGLVRAWFEFALVLVPIAFLAGARLRLTKIRILGSVLILATGIFQLTYAGIAEFFLPNYLSISGAYSAVLPPSKFVFSEIAWLVLVFVSILLGALMLFLLPTKFEYFSLNSIFAYLVILGTGFQFVIDQGVFFRYLLPIVPFFFTLLVTDSQTTIFKKIIVNRFAITHTTFIALLSFGLMVNSFTFDRARWDIATRISEQGVPAQRIDAGLEWLGWHSATGVVGNVRAGADPANYWGFNNLFESKPCFVITPSSDLPVEFNGVTKNWYLIDQVTFKTFIGFGDSRLFIYETYESDCKYA